MDLLSYPYWLLALIGSQATAERYKVLAAESSSFYYLFADEMPIYSVLTDKAEGFAPFSEIQKQNTVRALKYVDSVTGLRFTQTVDPVQANTLTFLTNSQSAGSYGYAYLPEIHPLGSDIFLASDPTNATLSVGTRGALTLLHEIGHALGLKHPHEKVDGLGANSVLSSGEDRVANTIMSYIAPSSEDFKFEFNDLDIAGLHYIYGPNNYARVGNDRYNLSATQSNFIWDGGGVDTVDASNLPTGITLHLVPGHHDFIGVSRKLEITSQGQITINHGTMIENVIGSGFDDFLYGNSQNNVITGNGGANTIAGGGGIDTAQYNDAIAAVSLHRAIEVGDNAWRVQLPNGVNDILYEVERLSFRDLNLAIDLNGNAGATAKLLGAFLGAKGIKESSLVGFGLKFLDGGNSLEDLIDLAYTTIFGTSPDIQSVISKFYYNLTGLSSPLEIVTRYTNLIDEGELTLNSLAVQVSEHELNLSNINFIGLYNAGLEYS